MAAGSGPFNLGGDFFAFESAEAAAAFDDGVGLFTHKTPKSREGCGKGQAGREGFRFSKRSGRFRVGPIKNQTFRLELIRALSSGVLETAAATFVLMIAVRHYEASALSKATLAAAHSVGLLLTPLVVVWAARTRWPSGKAASLIFAVGCGAYAVAALPSFPCFVIGSSLGMMGAAMAIPLFTQIYQDNYPEGERGRLFSQATLVRIGAVAGFSWLGGRLLSWDLEWFPFLLGVFAMAYGVSFLCARSCPSRPLNHDGAGTWLRGFRFFREDKVFRYILFSWMLMGAGNLMMNSLRIEYLANPVHGLQLTPWEIALLAGVIPNAARLAMVLVWGRLFDRVNFFLMRIALNASFMMAILAFYTGTSWAGLVAGALIFGVANAGGEIAWNLWVTKIAPEKHVADYMSIHTMLTGVRGIAAPFVAFSLIGVLSISTLAWISAGLILLGTWLLVPEIRSGRFRRAAVAVDADEPSV
jgi:MFS family permease